MGRHYPFSSSSGSKNGTTKVIGYTWDWSGMLTYFVPFFFLIQIQDKLFFNYSCNPYDFHKISKIFDNDNNDDEGSIKNNDDDTDENNNNTHSIGTYQTFIHRNFYKRGE